MLSVPEILDLIRADFEARSIDVEVIFGAWNTQKMSGAGRIVIGLGDFDLEPPGEVGAPGVRDIGDDEGARALFSRIQTMNVRIHARPTAAERDPKRSEKAQKDTAELLHKFLRAFYAATYGSFVSGRGTWPQPQEGGQDFLYGSVADVFPRIMIPVEDDPMASLMVDVDGSATQTISIDAAGGEEVVAETPAP